MTRLPEGIVECTVDQCREKGVAHVARCASELSEGMVGDRAGGKMALADGTPPGDQMGHEPDFRPER
jgi:hypothetical protein